MHWMRSLCEGLRRFVSNKNEKIVSVLGKVYQKKGIFSFPSNIQHRIPITEMKGIKVGTIHRFEMFLFGIISAFVLAAEIKREVWLITHEDSLEVVDSISSVVPLGTLAEFVLVFGIILALVMFVYYIAQALLVKRTMVCIEMSGITVNFLVCELGKQEIKDFYRDVSDMQNDRISSPQNVNVSQTNTVQDYATSGNESFDRVTKLTELSQLYEKGLLQQEEFERLKSEVIGK